MSVQTSVTARAPLSVPGQVFDSSFNDVVSGVAAGAFSFGAYVVESATGWRLPASAAEVQTLQGGVAIVDNHIPSGKGYVVGDNVSVLRRGRVAVKAEDTFALGNSVFVRISGTGNVGDFANAADLTNTVACASFRVHLAGGANVLEINPPVSA